MRRLLTAICSSAALWCGGAHADEIARLHADLDGDGKPETVILSVSGTGDFRHFTVTIGTQSYSDEYFAALGEQPEIKAVAIDWKRPQRQVFVTTAYNASMCGYYLLSYAGGHLGKLISSASEGCGEVPQPEGNGVVAVPVWMSFWAKNETYKLDSAGTKLVLQPVSTYPVGVAVAAARDIVLEAADCKDHKLSRGQFVRIMTYDPAKRRYLLKNLDGACGWLTEDQVQDDLAEVPYAN